MDELELLNSGYNRYRHNPDNIKTYISSFQKSFVDEKGVKFLIDCDVFDFKILQPNSAEDLWFDFRAKLSINGLLFSIKTIDWFKGISDSKPTLSDIESLLESIWINNKCDYHEIYPEIKKK